LGHANYRSFPGEITNGRGPGDRTKKREKPGKNGSVDRYGLCDD